MALQHKLVSGEGYRNRDQRRTYGPMWLVKATFTRSAIMAMYMHPSTHETPHNTQLISAQFFTCFPCLVLFIHLFSTVAYCIDIQQTYRRVLS